MITTIALAGTLVTSQPATSGQRLAHALAPNSAEICPSSPSSAAANIVLLNASATTAPSGEQTVMCKWQEGTPSGGSSALPTGDYDFVLRCPAGTRLRAPGYTIGSSTYNYAVVSSLLPVADSYNVYSLHAIVRVSIQLPTRLTFSLQAICG